jgi:proteasome accessory factor A
MKRIVGVETEFGCLVHDSNLGRPEDVVEQIKDHTFRDRRWGVIDRHARDAFFEPAEAGGFLINGGRLYIDVVGSHLEYATPECRSIRDLIAYDRAGQRLIIAMLKELGWANQVSFHNNNVDHYGGHTFGCHENYSLSLDANRYRGEDLDLLFSFLVTRQIYCGSGRVGGHRLTEDPHRMFEEIRRHRADYAFIDQIYGVEPDPDVEYQLSQRADHILHEVSGRVRFHRALINPKWDMFRDNSQTPRLHVLFGEANQSEYTTFLKIGTTALVLDMIEARCAPKGVKLASSIMTLKSVSRDSTWSWITRLEDGRSIRVVDLQRCFLKAAERFRGRDAETDEVLDGWEMVLDGLERDPLELADRLDWVAKYKLLNLYRETEALVWNHPAIHSLDLEYHNINPEQGLYYALQESEGLPRLVSDDEIERAMCEGPRDTRAQARAQVVQALRNHPTKDYLIEWDGVTLGAKRAILFDDPFDTYQEEVSQLLQGLPRTS